MLTSQAMATFKATSGILFLTMFSIFQNRFSTAKGSTQGTEITGDGEHGNASIRSPVSPSVIYNRRGRFSVETEGGGDGGNEYGDVDPSSEKESNADCLGLSNLLRIRSKRDAPF